MNLQDGHIDLLNNIFGNNSCDLNTTVKKHIFYTHLIISGNKKELLSAKITFNSHILYTHNIFQTILITKSSVDY